MLADPDQTDESLASAAIQDPAAYRVLMERHQHRLFVFARGMLGCRHDSEDVLQESFLAAYRALNRFDPTRARFSTWLQVIVRNRCLHRLRARQRRPETQALQDPPAKTEAGGEWQEALDAALARLPTRLRIAFVLQDIQQLTVRESAAIAGVPEGTIKSRASRARKRLRSALQSLRDPD